MPFKFFRKNKIKIDQEAKYDAIKNFIDSHYGVPRAEETQVQSFYNEEELLELAKREQIGIEYEQLMRKRERESQSRLSPGVSKGHRLEKRQYNTSQESIEARLRRISMEETFSRMLLRLIDQDPKKRTDVAIYKKALVDRKLFSKIRSKEDYKPSKNTVLLFAIALELSLDVTLDLLNKAEYTLSRTSKRDIIIEQCIIEKNYDIDEINGWLYKFEQSLLGV